MKKQIKTIEYNIISQLSESTFNLKVTFLDDGMKIIVKGTWYEYELKTKRNIKFIKSILNEIDALQIENWQQHYDFCFDSNFFITDLPSWKLKITYINKEELNIDGYGAYPKNWNKFEKIIQKLMPINSINKYMI